MENYLNFGIFQGKRFFTCLSLNETDQVDSHRVKSFFLTRKIFKNKTYFARLILSAKTKINFLRENEMLLHALFLILEQAQVNPVEVPLTVKRAC